MITERAEYFYLSAFETEYKKRAQSFTLYQAAIIDNLFKKDLQTFRPLLTLFSMCIRVLLFLINTEGGMWDKINILQVALMHKETN